MVLTLYSQLIFQRNKRMKSPQATKAYAPSDLFQLSNRKHVFFKFVKFIKFFKLFF